MNGLMQLGRSDGKSPGKLVCANTHSVPTAEFMPARRATGRLDGG